MIFPDPRPRYVKGVPSGTSNRTFRFFRNCDHQGDVYVDADPKLEPANAHV